MIDIHFHWKVYFICLSCPTKANHRKSTPLGSGNAHIFLALQLPLLHHSSCQPVDAKTACNKRAYLRNSLMKPCCARKGHCFFGPISFLGNYFWTNLVTEALLPDRVRFRRFWSYIKTRTCAGHTWKFAVTSKEWNLWRTPRFCPAKGRKAF